MINTGLFFTKESVCAGMVVALAVEGKTEPEQDPDGNLLIGRFLFGGVNPLCVGFVPIQELVVRESQVWSPVEKKMVTAQSLQCSFAPLHTIPSTTRFMPIDVFTPDNAPANRRFVVVVGSECIRYTRPNENRWDYIQVRTDDCGRLVDDMPYECATFGNPYTPPTGAMLVPID